jgi:TPR repeat protein
MSKRFMWLLLLILPIFIAAKAQAEVKEYIRDYNYQGESYDTVASCRANAISGVKRELLDELGTYIGSVVKMHQDSLGNSYMSHDVVNITAGIVAMKVIDEKWTKPIYFVKAGMKADADDVLVKLKAMRSDFELEKSLRNSFEELKRARDELEELKAQLAQLKHSGVIIASNPTVVAAPQVEPDSNIKRMQKIEDQMQKELASSIKESTEVVDEGKRAGTEVAKVSVALGGADLAQKELSKEVSKEQILATQLAAAKKESQHEQIITSVLPVTSDQPNKVTPPEEKQLVASYQKAVQNIEVEEVFRRGLMAQISGDFVSLVKEIEPLADKGYSRAQARMGWIYERGLGVTQDYQKALAWYEKATLNGAKNAPAHIGLMYELGYGVQQDYAKAADYYKRSIEMGGSLGYARMGFLHEAGKGVQLDRIKAEDYYERAIAKGSYHAMTLMGLLYQKGHGGLDKDEKKAVELYQQSIDHGEPLAMARLGEMYNQGLGGLPVDHEKAIALLRESARYKIPAAYAHLGRMYEEGWATQKDYAEAKRLYEQAAEHDAIFAMKRLGFMYKEGLGVPRDYDKAADWFKRAAKLGDDKSVEVLRKRAYWH